MPQRPKLQAYMDSIYEKFIKGDEKIDIECNNYDKYQFDNIQSFWISFKEYLKQKNVTMHSRDNTIIIINADTYYRFDENNNTFTKRTPFNLMNINKNDGLEILVSEKRVLNSIVNTEYKWHYYKVNSVNCNDNIIILLDNDNKKYKLIFMDTHYYLYNFDTQLTNHEDYITRIILEVWSYNILINPLSHTKQSHIYIKIIKKENNNTQYLDKTFTWSANKIIFTLYDNDLYMNDKQIYLVYNKAEQKWNFTHENQVEKYSINEKKKHIQELVFDKFLIKDNRLVAIFDAIIKNVKYDNKDITKHHDKYLYLDEKSNIQTTILDSNGMKHMKRKYVLVEEIPKQVVHNSV